MENKGSPASSVEEDVTAAHGASEQHFLNGEYKWKHWDLRFAVFLKFAQIVAFLAAGLWVLYSTHLLRKKEETRSATYGCFATTTFRVNPIPGGDAEKSRYLVTVDTLVQNNTDRVVSIGSYTLDLYLGKPVAEAKPGFLVSKPGAYHPTMDWKHLARFASIQRDDYEALERIRDNKQLNDSEPIAITKESDIRLETFSFLRLPAGQPWTFESQFVISASESDWIATDSVLIYDKGTNSQGDIPETRLENIAIALHRTQIELKSPPPGSNSTAR